MTYEFHPHAQLEYREAASFYENRNAGLGVAFTLDVEETIARILEAPERWRIIEQDVRRCLTHTFPYGVLYTIEPGSILIIARNAFATTAWLLAQSTTLTSGVPIRCAA